jgi:hypothetical protein
MSGVASMALLLTAFTPSALAQMTHYTDVPSGAYYEQAASELLRSGALDTNEARLRPGELATRAEVMKLLVNVYGADMVTPSTPSFGDVPKSAWYYSYMETAAREGWVKGDSNCYGTTASRCMARPGDGVNRAEMAIILQRAFRLPHLELAPVFSDNTNRGNWYFVPVQTAADHCILQGDAGSTWVRPSASMNRAEMVVMFYRAQQQMRYGQDCAEPTGQITNVESLTAKRIRVMFNTDLDANTISQESRYSVHQTSGSEAGAVVDVHVVNARTVELELAGSLTEGRSYRLEVDNMRTENGTIFDDSQTFTAEEGDTASIESITARSSTMVRVVFSQDVEEDTAEDEGNYEIERVGTTSMINVQSAVLVDDDTVDLTLQSALASGTSYRVIVDDMETTLGVMFSGERTFSSLATAEHLQSAVPTASNRVRLTFNTDLDTSDASNESRYSIARLDGVGSTSIQNASVVSSRIVDLTINGSFVMDVDYEVELNNLEADDGSTLSEQMTFTYEGVVGRLTGVTTVSNTRLRLTFDTDLDVARAEQSVRYTVTDGSSSISVQTADLLSDQRTVELQLAGSLQNQTAYTVNVIDLRTSNGVNFSGNADVVYVSGNVQLSDMLLTGAKESPPVGTSATGTGTFTLTSSGLQYDITYSNLSSSFTGAHFHRGSTGSNGAVVHEISFSGNRATGTWTNISSELRNAILDEEIYVNIHSSNFPNGEIRGQLMVP